MLPVNTWSCGDYNNNLNGIHVSGNANGILSTDYHTAGDTSLKITMFVLNTAYYADYESFGDFNELGKTVTFAADVYTNYACSIRIYTYVGGYTQSIVDIPSNSSGTYSVSRTIPSDATKIIYRVEPRSYSNSDAFCYTDNWRLTFQ